MRKFFNGLLLGIILGAGGAWFYASTYSTPNVQEAERRAAVHADKAVDAVQGVADSATRALAAKLMALDLRVDDVAKELTETGKVVRRRAHDLGEGLPMPPSMRGSPLRSRPSSPPTPSCHP